MDETLFAAARAAEGFMPDDEGLALHEAGLAAAALGPLLEIGTYCGKSAIYLGAAARAGGSVLYTVDHHRGSEDVVIAVVGSSPTVAAHWATPLGLLFVDGGHAFDAALADYVGWSRFVVPGGTLVFHDIFEDPAVGGQAPYEVWQRAVADGFAPVGTTGSLRVLRKPA